MTQTFDNWGAGVGDPGAEESEAGDLGQVPQALAGVLSQLTCKARPRVYFLFLLFLAPLSLKI